MKKVVILIFGCGCLVVGCSLLPKGTLPNVTLENDMICIGGSFGGNFNVSEIKTIDTVSVYPKVGIMRGGNGLPGVYVGNFDLANENVTAKLCIYRNNPPYIKLRMNDNRLLLINFKEPDKTVEFYNQIQNALITDLSKSSEVVTER